MATDNEKNEDIIQVGKLVFFRNVLLFENTAYQISNICSIWVENKSYTVEHEFPKDDFWGGIFWGGILLSLGVYNGNNNWWILATIIGGLLIFGSVITLLTYKSESHYSKFSLAFELNSGKHTYFTSSDEDFVNRAAHSLVQTMSRGISNEEKLVLNFDNKTINIEKATNSNIIGGNVYNSLVDSV